MQIFMNRIARTAMLAAGCALAAAALAQAPKTGWQWAAGGQGSINANAALAASQTIRQAGFEVYAVNSGGTIDSLLTLSRGEYDFANVDTPTLRKVWTGTGGFQQIKGFSQVLTGFTTFFFIVVPESSAIKTVADLVGKTINGHTPGAVINLWNQDYVQALGQTGVVRPGSIKISQIALSQAVDALLDGRSSAQVGYTFSGKLPDWVDQATARGIKLRVLRMPEPVNKLLISKGWQSDDSLDVAEVKKIDATLQANEYRTNGITTVIVARQNLGDDVVHKFLTAFFADVGKIGATHPANLVYKEGPAYGVKFLTDDLPVHPGAMRFYRERNVLRPTLSSTPK
jgi:TRAP transporter TAXI family solute receptor